LPRRALFFLCLLSGAVLGLWWAEGKRGRGAEPTGAVAPAQVEPAELLPPAASEPSATSPAIREAVAAEKSEVPAAAEASPAPAPLVRLRGVLRFSHDGRLATGQPLEFLSGEALARVVTDSSGRFETEAIFPSGFGYTWHALEGRERPRALTVEPAHIVVRDDFAGERVQDLELVLLEPDAWLRVQVTANGVPTLAALYWQTTDARGTASTDEDGRAEIGLIRLEPGVELSLRAQTVDAVSPRVKRVFPWPDELITLALQPAGRIRARVRDEAGIPLENELVRVEDGPLAWTDSDGEARVERVLAGDAVVSCGAQRREVTVVAGEELALEFVFPAGELVAAGRVLDESERPLADVWVGAANTQDAESIASTRSDANGLFELRARPGEAALHVWVFAGGGVEAELYQPAERCVPSGSGALVFRRVPSPEKLELNVVALDAITEKPIPNTRYFLYRRGQAASFDLYGSPGGMSTCTLRPYDDALVRASAVGYLPRTIAWPDVPAPAREGKPLYFELERGFEHDLVVLDKETQRPLAGALVLSGDSTVATTDAQGRAHVRLDDWPPSLRVELAGYAGQEYDQKEIVCSLKLTCALAPEG
jgi:hypothetical protein